MMQIQMLDDHHHHQDIEVDNNPSTLCDFPVLVLNLKRRTDRWRHASNQLRSNGFNNVHRIEAIEGKLLSNRHQKLVVSQEGLQSLRRPRKRHEELGTLGAVGCFLSHMLAWQHILDIGQPMIIMEDDALFRKDWKRFSIFRNPHNQLKSWDLVLIGYSLLRHAVSSTDKKMFDTNHQQQLATSPIKPLTCLFFGTQFYYVTPKAASLLLKHALPLSVQVDTYIAEQILQGPQSLQSLQDNRQVSSNDMILAGYHTPSLVGQLMTGTDIQSPCPGCDSADNNDDKLTTKQMVFFGSALAFVSALIIWLLVSIVKTKRSTRKHQ